MHWLAVAIGGALGALSRYAVTAHLMPAEAGRIPTGTLLVNVLGSFLMGVFFVLIFERGLMTPEWRSVITAGFLGAFTTFSTFSLESFVLWQHGHVQLAISYVAISVISCLLAVASGAFMVSRIF